MTAPLTDRLVRSVLERHVARLHRRHLAAQHTDLLHVRPLTLCVRPPHVDHTFHAHQCADAGHGHTVLSCARLSDHPPPAQMSCQQHLSQCIVDLVRARVVQVFPFEVESASVAFRHACRTIKWRRPTRIVAQQCAELLHERFALDHAQVTLAQLLHTSVQDLWHVRAAKRSVVSFRADPVIVVLSFHSFGVYVIVLLGGLHPGHGLLPENSRGPAASRVRQSLHSLSLLSIGSFVTYGHAGVLPISRQYWNIIGRHHHPHIVIVLTKRIIFPFVSGPQR